MQEGPKASLSYTMRSYLGKKEVSPLLDFLGICLPHLINSLRVLLPPTEMLLT